MFNKEPQKINPNDSGIDFSKSEMIRKHFKNEKNNLYLSGYFGRDVFSQGFGFDYGNQTTTARWNHIFNDKLFLNTTAYYSNYDFQIGVGSPDEGGFKWRGNICRCG